MLARYQDLNLDCQAVTPDVIAVYTIAHPVTGKISRVFMRGLPISVPLCSVFTNDLDIESGPYVQLQ
jgi:hypothetical protein